MQKSDKNADPSKLVDEYISSAEEFARSICWKLREIILKSDKGIHEEWKWGPNYQKEGMICGFGAFKQHVTLSFFKGSLLSDPEKILTQGGSNLHTRSFKISSLSEVKPKIITAYVKEAIKLNENGAKPVKKELGIPEPLLHTLSKKNLKNKFDELTYTEKKEFIISVRDAKKDETRERRINKVVDYLKVRSN